MNIHQLCRRRRRSKSFYLIAHKRLIKVRRSTLLVQGIDAEALHKELMR